MNASKKSDYTVVKFSKQGKIETISDLKSELLARFTDRLSGDVEVGYINSAWTWLAWKARVALL